MIRVGDFYISKKVVLDETVRAIAAVSGDINPVHLDDAYAQNTIFGGRIAHGLFCLNEISMILGNYLPGPGSILLSQEFKYIKPVFIGDKIETKVIVDKIIEDKDIYILNTICFNQNGQIVLSGTSKIMRKNKRMKLSDFMNVIDGVLINDGEFETLEYCTAYCEKGFLTFLEDLKYLNKINGNVKCIITTKNAVDKLPEYIQGIVVAEEPKKCFVELHNYLANNNAYCNPQFKTIIGENCNISPLACIAEENVVIGNNVYIAPFTVIKENVSIGNNCNIYENCVIGGKSFNFVKTKDGRMIGMADLGRVVIEDNVDICSFCHVAGCPLPTDVTKLEENVKLDAMVHIGHGTKIGERTEIPAGAQIAGNCIIGKDVWIGVNATIANRLHIEDKGRVSLGAVVTKNVEAGQTVTGNFAVDHSRFIKELKIANSNAYQ